MSLQPASMTPGYKPFAPPLTVPAKKKQTSPIQGALNAPPTYDPAFRALTPQQMQTQASSSVQSQINPILDQINQAIAARSRAGQNAITAYTGQLQQNLAPLAGQTEASYQHGEDALSGMQQALAARLAAAGQGASSATSGALTAAGQDTAPADRATAFANGASATGLAGGNADLSALRTQGLASADYSRALPGIAGLSGLQQSGNLQSQLSHDLADQTGKVTSQVPGLVNSVLSDLRSNELTKANARYGEGRDQVSDAHWQTQFDASQAGAAASARDKQAQAAATADYRGEQIASTNLKTKAALLIAAQSAGDKQATAKALQEYRQAQLDLKAAQQGSLDTYRQGQLAIGQQNADTATTKANKPPKASAPKTPTGAQVSSLIDEWKNGKHETKRVLAPEPDPNGNPVYRTVDNVSGKLSYKQAYRRLRAMKLKDKQARQYLGTAFKRGEQGRAWLTNEEQTTLRKAGRQASAGSYQGHAFLAPHQVETLKAAGMLPSGELAGGRYFIRPDY